MRAVGELATGVVPSGVAVLILLLATTGWSAARKARPAAAVTTSPTAPTEAATSPGQSAFFSSGTEQAYSTYQMPGDGDLWPSCWANDDNLYTANGDGAAFTGKSARPDMQVSRISGMPPHLSGTPLAEDVGTNWSGRRFNRKPTGMLCVGGALYLAFQNLEKRTFNSAPTASIAESLDHGKTWTWNTETPMFGGPGKAPLFTTVFFLDFGKDSADAIDHYVYAYGLDNNWRSQDAMFLARVPERQVITRSAWEFYAGTDAKGRPRWTPQIEAKQPVLLDTRRVMAEGMGSRCPVSDGVIAQGGVVYDKPLKRYLFTSWSCSTHEFYEAPKPWGPWRHVLSRDFGGPWSAHNRGQYGTSVPSKFISADGRRFLLQSNVCCSGDSYTFSLREVQLDVAPGAERRGWAGVRMPKLASARRAKATR